MAPHAPTQRPSAVHNAWGVRYSAQLRDAGVRRYRCAMTNPTDLETPRAAHEIDCDLDEDCTCGAALEEEQLLLATIFADDPSPLVCKL